MVQSLFLKSLSHGEKINMAPIRVFTNWDKRSSDDLNQIEPYRTYYFLCEGENTERWYFKKLIENQKVLHLNPGINVCFLERTEVDLHNSNPRKLLNYANQQVRSNQGFDKKYDKIVIVFDADIFTLKNKSDELFALIDEMEAQGHIVALTNPSFELFLLLHVANSVADIILPRRDKILKNIKISKSKRYIEKLLSDTVKCNPKKNCQIGELCLKLHIAEEQEQKINRDIKKADAEITSNICKILQGIRAERGNI